MVKCSKGRGFSGLKIVSSNPVQEKELQLVKDISEDTPVCWSSLEKSFLWGQGVVQSMIWMHHLTLLLSCQLNKLAKDKMKLGRSDYS